MNTIMTVTIELEKLGHSW